MSFFRSFKIFTGMLFGPDYLSKFRDLICGSNLFMNLFNSFFWREIGFWIPEVIQGFILKLSIYLLIFLIEAYLLSKEFTALRKLFVNKSIIFIQFQKMRLIYIKVDQGKFFVVNIWSAPTKIIAFIWRWIIKSIWWD